MSEEETIIVLIWKDGDFTLSSEIYETEPTDSVLVVDNNNQSITLKLADDLSLIERRTIERRIQSISKSGYFVSKLNTRIGMNFRIDKATKTESIPNNLLQEGHKYTFHENDVSQEGGTNSPSSSVYNVKNGTPTFSEIEKENTSTVVEDLDLSSDPKSVLGRFLVGILDKSELFISKQEEMYILEFSSGRIDFLIEAGKIKIISKKKVSDEDEILLNAKDFAEKNLL